MLATDRDALICDLAETYHVFDYRALPVPLLVTLSCGLRANSRIKMKLAGLKDIPLSTMFAVMSDNLTYIRHWLTNDKKLNKESLFSNILTTEDKPKQATFASSEDFMSWRNRIIGDNNDG